jgi:hypothetical protein
MDFQAWLILLTAGSPWLVGIVYYWHRRPRDGAIPTSMADRVRHRLWTDLP